MGFSSFDMLFVDLSKCGYGDFNAICHSSEVLGGMLDVARLWFD